MDFIFCPTKRQYKLALNNSPMAPIKTAQFGHELAMCVHIEKPLDSIIYDSDMYLCIIMRGVRPLGSIQKLS